MAYGVHAEKYQAPCSHAAETCANCEEPIYEDVFIEGMQGYTICKECVRNGGMRSKGTGWRAIEDARAARHAAAVA